MAAMHPATQHFILLLFAAAFAAFGWFLARKPSKAYRLFTFGVMPVPERSFFVGFIKVTGWLFAVLFAVGAIGYSFLIVLDLIRR